MRRMKKFALSILAALCASVAVTAQTPDTDWYTANPGAASFTISTADELAGLAVIVNGTWGGAPQRDGFDGKTIALINDIDLSDYSTGEGWVPIGNYVPIYNDVPAYSNTFSGIFDGGGHIISNLVINRPYPKDHSPLRASSNYQGLFGFVTNGRVENLGLDNVNIVGGILVGGLVGYLGDSSSVTNCYSTGIISAEDGVGGVVGVIARREAYVTNSYSASTVNGDYGVGGIAGLIDLDAHVANCYSTGAVSGRSGVGGVVGIISTETMPIFGMSNGSVTNSAALNSEVRGDDGVGRVVGMLTGLNIRSITLSNNVAYAEMMNSIDGINDDADSSNGANITVAAIIADPTIGGRFTGNSGWTTGDGKLPGFVMAIEFPSHFTEMVYGIIVSPAEASVSKESERLFKANVFGQQNADKAVTWAVSGNTSSSTTVSATGLLFIAVDETATSIIVVATSVINAGVSDTAVVTIVDARWYTDAIAADPEVTSFTISTAEELAGLARIVNGTLGGESEMYDFSGKIITLANNIDLSKYDNWTPIGNSSSWFDLKPFSGTFNGNGYTINNLTINRSNAGAQGLFGYVNGGRVENLGLNGVNVQGGGYVGGLVGYLHNNGVVANCYSVGVVSGAQVGGLVGRVQRYCRVSNSYSAGVVNGVGTTGSNTAGGIVGIIVDESSIANSYSISEIRGTGGGTQDLGGIAGWAAWGASVNNCAALNPTVRGTGGSWRSAMGRVVGSIGDGGVILSNNVAYAGMINSAGNNTWDDKGTSRKDGADISAVAINANGTIGGLFTDTDVWTTEAGRIPSLFGKAVDMPAHLHPDYISIATPDRVIPQGNGSVNDVAVVAPVNTSTTKFTAGPNPINKSSGPVNFYYQGKSIKSGTLTIYNASGNIINKIRIYEDPAGRGVARNALTTAESAEPRRVVGSWDLRDRKGRFVADGTYLVRGRIITLDGGREQVSAVVGVR